MEQAPDFSQGRPHAEPVVRRQHVSSWSFVQSTTKRSICISVVVQVPIVALVCATA
ncbi:hypothetical protein Trisim1_003195 [Trichoderma cf. simile WF8]